MLSARDAHYERHEIIYFTVQRAVSLVKMVDGG